MIETLSRTFRALGDETRLRILRLLGEQSLNVGELTSVLGLAQPTVSKHLGELRAAGLVEGSRRGGYTYYEINHSAVDGWKSIEAAVGHLEENGPDRVRLQEILKQREEYSEADRFVVPGRSWVSWSRALRFLLPELDVADFGCGDGAFTVEAARWARRVIAVDSNPAVLRLARKAAGGMRNVEFREEDMEQLSLQSESVDLVIISQSLHYVEHPPRVLAEAHRILKRAGRLLLIELLPHRQEWVASELKHRWKGFTPSRIERWLRDANFQKVRIDSDFKKNENSFQPFVAFAVKGRSL